ncbi:MAG: peptide chain release factor N(5)-glutamine methyltransferase [Clostridia bacterium]|nr:peptide chain release factor N(5)-glutamine methyltransferase [Clostridia bacterium]
MEESYKTIRQWRKEARAELERAGDMDAAWDVDWMLCEVFECGRAELKWIEGNDIRGEMGRQLHFWLHERMDGRPLQYILGHTGFMGIDILCDERALIPRQDTETLAELALHRMQYVKNPSVLDLCTGTGAIGLTMKHYRPDAVVTLADISEDALALAKKNADALELNVRILRGDLWEAVEGEKFDFILCNPPYLTDQDMKELMEEVRREPELALWGGSDGLGFYRRIAAGLDGALNENGEALLEIGRGQEKDVADLMNAAGFCAEAHKDLCGIDRVIRVWRGQPADGMI